jgi:hypothetical protein
MINYDENIEVLAPTYTDVNKKGSERSDPALVTLLYSQE